MIYELQQALTKVNAAKEEFQRIGLKVTPQKKKGLGRYDDAVFLALGKVSENLASSYRQACIDIEDDSRITYVSAATELREVLRQTLDILAPDSSVKGQPGFQFDPTLRESEGVSQKQKVLYILRSRKAGSGEKEVVKHIESVEDRVASLARELYKRASQATHISAGRTEAKKILNYFNAFAHDILDII